LAFYYNYGVMRVLKKDIGQSNQMGWIPYIWYHKKRKYYNVDCHRWTVWQCWRMTLKNSVHLLPPGTSQCQPVWFRSVNLINRFCQWSPRIS